jgi:hypothetical protein
MAEAGYKITVVITPKITGRNHQIDGLKRKKKAKIQLHVVYKRFI